MSHHLVVLGTASQAPTRERNHNGYLLRWGALGILFDPGEGTQRQLLLAGERSSRITHIAITHQHGDHVFGLPGVLQRMALDQRRDPVVLLHPADATAVIDHLLALVRSDPPLPLVRHVLPDDIESVVPTSEEGVCIRAVPLHHRVPALGYRLEVASGMRVDPERLAAVGLQGAAVGRLLREGTLVHDGRTIRAEDVTVRRPGRAVAFVMDTSPGIGVHTLLADAELAVVEATFLDRDRDLAAQFGHLTADQAGRFAAEAGVRRLVLTHYSQRYGDVDVFEAEAGRHHPDVIAAHDLQRVDVPAVVR